MAIKTLDVIDREKIFLRDNRIPLCRSTVLGPGEGGWSASHRCSTTSLAGAAASGCLEQALSGAYS
jgi:hypothetical protein